MQPNLITKLERVTAERDRIQDVLDQMKTSRFTGHQSRKEHVRKMRERGLLGPDWDVEMEATCP